MFIKLDRYSEEMFKVGLCAENARARIESFRLARATRTRKIFLASLARDARARDRPSAKKFFLKRTGVPFRHIKIFPRIFEHMNHMQNVP